MNDNLPNEDGRGTTASRILDAAELLFAERGFAGTAVRDIAAAVGLNPASLYNHFPGKQEMYEAVLDRALTPIFELLTELTSTRPTPGRDERIIEVIVDHIAANPAIARILQFEALGGGANLARLAGRWLDPIYSKGIEALRSSPNIEGWDSHELALLVGAFHNMILGYFVMAPVLSGVLGEDLNSSRALARHKVFLRKVAHYLVGTELPATE